MALDQKQIELFKGLQAEIAQAIETSDADLTQSEALIETFKETLVEYGEIDTIELVAHEDTSGQGRIKFDAVGLNETVARIDVVVTHLTDDDQPKISMSVIKKTVEKAARAFRAALKGNFTRFEGEALDTIERVNASKETYSSGRIILLTNGILETPEHFKDFDIEGFSISTSVFDLQRLQRLTQEASSLEDIHIEFEELLGKKLQCIEEDVQNKDYDTYLTLMSGELIFDLFEKFGPRLYEFNVRSFLQARGKVNKGIRKTLQEEPTKFLAYNNGLVATAQKLEIETLNGTPYLKSATGIQIVNGAQTTASIHRAKKIDRADISKVAVAAKITLIRNATDKDFVSNISQYANSQNSIQVADLSANHTFFVELERETDATWCPGQKSQWFFERARGSYQMAQGNAGYTAAQKRKFKERFPPKQVFKKTDVAMVLHAWQLKPYSVSLGGQKNFNLFMQEIHESGTGRTKPDQNLVKKVISLLILYKAVQKIVRQKKFPAYRANICAYTVSYLAHLQSASGEQLDLHHIWQKQNISEELSQMIIGLTDLIDTQIRKSAGSLNVTEHAKKELCWENVKKGVKNPDIDNIPEFAEYSPSIKSQKTADPAPDATSLIDWCKSLDVKTLATIQLFGNLNPGKLTRIEEGVVNTVLGYAKDKWHKYPSIKQSRRIKSAYDICKTEGLLDF